MSTPFQNRLVGTVIVAAVAIIFLPDLLDGEKESYQEEFDKIPSQPKVEFQPSNKSFPSDKIEQLAQEEFEDEVALDDPKPNESNSSAQIDNTANSSETTVVKPIEKQPESASTEVQNDRAEQAWVIQLGSFRHKQNVDDLVNKLEKAGYNAFTRPIKTKNGTLTKVFVGPELSHSSLEKKLPALKELTKVQGKVAKFQPTK